MKHEPKILLIDIDGTLTNEVCFTPEECIKATPKQDMIDWVNEKFNSDFVVIYTARRNALYLASMEWLEKHDVKFHAVRFEKTPGVIVDLDAINSII